MDQGLPRSVCIRCRHRRTRPKPILFGQNDLRSPGVLQAKLEWDQQLRQWEQAERTRFDADQDFDYEPYTYAWCAAYTPDMDVVQKAQQGDEQALLQIQEAVTMNPVTGELSRIFALCARVNPDGQCERYEPK